MESTNEILKELDNLVYYAGFFSKGIMRRKINKLKEEITKNTNDLQENINKTEAKADLAERQLLAYKVMDEIKRRENNENCRRNN
jgi:ribosomal protein L14E/L6E/L27E